MNCAVKFSRDPTDQSGDRVRPDRFVRQALAVAIVPPVLFTLLVVWWFVHVPPGHVFTGYLQGDQPTYMALARGAYERGNGLSYANPFDIDRNAPRVLTNLNCTLLGAALKAVGERGTLAWELWRIVFGAACYALFAAIVGRYFSSKRLRWWVFLAGAFGAGTAWIATLALYARQPALGWAGPFLEAEEGYGLWGLNLFRQSLNPLELAHHTLVFAAILLYLKRRYGWLLVVVFITWWADTIAALFASTLFALALAGDWLVGRIGNPSFRSLGPCGRVGQSSEEDIRGAENDGHKG